MLADIAGSVISHRNDRMGARIIAMLNGIRIAQDYDLPFFVGWTTHGLTSIELREPADIFDQAFVDEHFFDDEILTQIWSELVDLTTFRPSATAEEFRARAAKGETFLSEIHIGCIVLPWENPAEVASKLPTCLKHIPFSPTVTKAMAEIDELLKGRDLAAYHIRRGDIISGPITSQRLWPNKYIPRVFYEAHLKRSLEKGDATSIVFSDTAAETEQLKSLDERVLSFDDLLAGADLKPGQRDFLELYAMSRCKNIYGPPGSAFSLTAATIGDGTVHAVEHALPPEDRAEALNLLTDRLETKPQVFLGDGDLGQNFPFMIAHQVENSHPDRARDILEKRLKAGFTKDYIYDILCNLMASTGAYDDCETIRSFAYDREVHNEDAMASLNAYAAISQLRKGNLTTAQDYAMIAFWHRPLEHHVHTALNLLLMTEQIDPAKIYPYDPVMVRNQGGRKVLGDYGYRPYLTTYLGTEFKSAKPRMHFWEVVVRDWRHIHGRKRNRAFSNASRIGKRLEVFEANFAKLKGSPHLKSARGTFYMGQRDFDKAEKFQRAALAEDTVNPLFRKRLADVLFEKGDIEGAILEMTQATEASGDHICYLSNLAYFYTQIRNHAEARRLQEMTTEHDHPLIEVKLMAAEALRTPIATRDLALEEINKALALSPGSLKLLCSKARILVQMDRCDEAEAIFRTVAASNMATSFQMAQIYRQLSAAGRTEKVIEDIVHLQTALSFEEVRRMALGT